MGGHFFPESKLLLLQKLLHPGQADGGEDEEEGVQHEEERQPGEAARRGLRRHDRHVPDGRCRNQEGCRVDPHVDVWVFYLFLS